MSERGMALISALILLLVVSGLALALTTSGRIEVAMSGNEELYAGARAAAESGLNHAAVVILQATNNPTFPLSNLLRGPDNAIDLGNQAASENADNGIISHLIGGTPPWPVASGSAYSYNVRLFDDDDPAMKGTAFTAAELAAMAGGPVPPNQPEDGNRYNDINRRLVIRATGFGPRGTRVVLEQMLTPIKMPALLVDGDVLVGGSVQIVGSQGSVHANGDLTIGGTGVTIAESATATGTVTADVSWDPGGLAAGGMPRIPVPDVHAIDYFLDADFVLEADGRITNPSGATVYCDLAHPCRDVVPPGAQPPGTAFGWTFQAATGWSLSQNSANSATYYARSQVRITGDPGTPATPIFHTIIAEGNIEIVGNPELRPEPASELQFVTNQDLRIEGDLGVPLAFEGRILVREQVELAGNPALAGQVIVQDVPSVSTLVTSNSVTGSVTLSYTGLVETVAYTVSGWRENP